MPFDSIKYKNDYNREHYKRLCIALKKEDAEKFKFYCDTVGLSYAEALKRFIDEACERI